MDDLEMLDMVEDIEYELEESYEPIVKGILLENGIYLVARIQEVQAQYGMPDCKLINPFRIIASDVSVLESFPKHTSQKEILISSSKILTLFDPSDIILDKYNMLTQE